MMFKLLVRQSFVRSKLFISNHYKLKVARTDLLLKIRVLVVNVLSWTRY